MDEIWKDQIGNVVLFTWHQFLLEESLEFLGIIDTFEIQSDFYEKTMLLQNSDYSPSTLSLSTKNQSRAVQDIKSREEILPFMLTYNQKKKEKMFKLSTFTCQICFDTKVGSDCIQFPGILILSTFSHRK